MSSDTDHLTERETHRLRERIGPLLSLPGLAAASSDARTGRFLEVNEEFCRLTGYAAGELRAMSSLDLLRPEDRRAYFDLASRMLHGEFPGFRIEERYFRKDGGTIRVEVESALFQEEPQPWVLTLVRDVTARHAAEEALRESERRAREMADASPVMIWLSDAGKRATYFNQAWLRFTGRAHAQQLGYGWAEGIHPDDVQRCIAAYEAAAAAREPFQVEYRLRRYDGTYRWVLDQAVPRLAGAAFLGFAGGCIDVTERKQAELDLEAAKEAAEADNREKESFFATLSHELRTPLAPMLAVVERFDRDPAFRAQHRAGLGLIRRNIELEARLIDELLDVTRITGGKLEIKRERIDLHQVLRHSIETCRPAGDVEGEPVLDVELAAADPWLWGDEARLTQALVEVIGNALKFTPPDGAVAVRTREEPPPAGGPGRDLVVEVADTGIGIPAEVLPRVFGRFEQGALYIGRRYGGLGLGLAIARSVVELHGGSISAESAGEGKGATLTVRLPGAEVPRPGVEKGAAPAEMPPGEGEAEEETPPLNILLVEDHSDTARAMAELLELLGHSVKLATTVAEALEVAEAGAGGEGSPFDVLISDIGLPDGSGLELMQRLQARYARAGIALSGYGTVEDRQRSTEAGFALHLTKPVSLDRLKQALRAVTRAGG